MNFADLHPKVVLGIAAHPDDLDVSASGTLAKFAAEGADVYYLILTDGSKGTEDRTLTSEELVRIREEEQRAGAAAIGAKGVAFLGYPDGGLEVTMELKEKICQEIRRVKPDVVITMDPSVLFSAERGFINHPDHRAAGQAALDAVFPLARDHLTFPHLLEAGFEPHKTTTVLLTNFNESNFYVDITDVLDKKQAALRAHVSQFGEMEKVVGWMTEMAQETGKKTGASYAEGFVRIDIR